VNLLSFIALSLATVSAVADGYHLSPGSSSKSPDGKWELLCKAPANGVADARHVLLLKRIKGGVFELRRIEGRGYPALWSPDSSRIALTDRWASDRSDVLIYSVALPRSERSLAKLFPRTAIPGEELDGHCYFEAVKWLNGRHLQIRISGHRDEYPANGFDYEFIFDLASGGFKKVTKKKPNQSVERTGAELSWRTVYHDLIAEQANLGVALDIDGFAFAWLGFGGDEQGAVINVGPAFV